VRKLKILGLGALAAFLLLVVTSTASNIVGQTPSTDANNCGYGGYVAYQPQVRQFQVSAYQYYPLVVNGQWVTPRWHYNYTGQLTNGQWVYNVNLYGFEVINNVSWCVTPGPYQVPNYNVNYWTTYHNVAMQNQYLVQFNQYAWAYQYYLSLRQYNPGVIHNVNYVPMFAANGCYNGPSNLPRYNTGC
jgi:hypothetical protein